MMNLVLAALGLGAAYVVLKGGSSSGASTAPTTAQANAFQSAQAFDAQAAALGLTQAQAQEAWDLGLTPQEYSQGMLGGGGGPITPTSGAPLRDHGEHFMGHKVYRDIHTGAPVMVDGEGNMWTFSEEAA